MSQTPRPSQTPVQDSWDQRERLLEQFEAALQSGQKPSLDSLLPADAGQRRKLLIELIHTELEYRLRAGEAARVEEYLGRYPELRGDAETALDLVEVEYRQRRQREPALSAEEYLARFPGLRMQLLNRLDTQTLATAGGQAGAAPLQRLRPGEERRYVPLSFHARGGLGEVYLAEDRELGRQVALKRIQPQRRGEGTSQRRFLREAKITGQLAHPGVVPVYGLVEDEAGSPCYAMRFIQGESLRDAAERLHAPGLTPTERGRLLRQLLGRFVTVCNTMAYAHSRGFLHRDLKPANIMLGDYGETLVVDWGLARRLQEADETSSVSPAEAAPGETREGDFLGTPGFASPEQAIGDQRRVGPASDVYSLGATLFALLTNQPPVQGANRIEMLTRSMEGIVRSAREVNKDVPAALESICRKALAKEPKDRYADALTLASDVERWLADEPVSAHREGLRQRLGRWVRRHSTWVQAGSAALLLLAVGAVAAALAVNEQRRQAESARAGEAEQRTAADLARQGEFDARQRAEARERQERRTRYAAEMQFGWSEWKSGQVANVRRLLTRQWPRSGEEDLRGFEWYHLWRLSHGGGLASLSGHSDEVRSIVFSPGGDYLATAGADGRVKFWDHRAGRELRSLPAEGRAGPPLLLLAFAAEGKELLTVSEKGDVRVWNPNDGRVIRSFSLAGGPFRAADLSPDGKRLVISSKHSDRADRARQPDVATIHDAVTGQLVGTFPASTSSVYSVAFSPDSQRLAVGSTDGLVVYQAGTRKAVSGLPLDQAAWALAWSPDGQTVAAGCDDGLVHLCDLPGNRLRAVLRGHTDALEAMTFSPDGRLLASASNDRTVRLWDVETTLERAVLGKHTNAATAVAFSPDGRLLATGSHDMTVVLWDPARDPTYDALTGVIENVEALAFTPDSKRLLTAGGIDDSGEVLCWDALSGTLQGAFPAFPEVGTVVGFSPDGKTLAVALASIRGGMPVGPGRVELWDRAEGVKIRAWEVHADIIHALEFTPDGKTLLVAAAPLSIGPEQGPGTGQLSWWDVATGKRQATLPILGGPPQMALTPDGKTLAVSARGGILLLDAQTRQRQATLRSDEGPCYCLAFSADGKMLAAGHSATAERLEEEGSVTLWDVSSGERRTTLKGHEGAVIALAFSPDGAQLASGSADRTARLWSLPAGKLLHTLPSEEGLVAWLGFAADGRSLHMLSCGKQLREKLSFKELTEWDPATGKVRGRQTGTFGHTALDIDPARKTVAFHEDGGRIVLRELAKPGSVREVRPLSHDPSVWHQGTVMAVAVSADGKTVATGGVDRTVRLWDVDSRKPLGVLRGHEAPVTCLAFTPDGSQLVSGSGGTWRGAESGEVRLWEVAAQRQLRALPSHARGVVSLALAPDGKSVAWASGRGKFSDVTLSDLATGEVRARLPADNSLLITCLAFSPTNGTLATGGLLLRLWNVKSGESEGALVGHGPQSLVRALAFSPNGRTFASAASDQTVRLWSPTTGQLLLSLPGHSDHNTSLVFSPDGTMLALGGSKQTLGQVRIWRAATAGQVAPP